MDASLGRFDSVVMLGQNFGPLRSPTRVERTLRHRRKLADRIIAETFDPYALATNAAYRERNLARGRREGGLRVRVRHQQHATKWQNWLQVSRDELKDLATSSGWRVERLLGDGPSYVAILDPAPPG